MKSLLFLLCAATSIAADSPQLHPKGSALPFTHQGPFVTTADGGVLCVDCAERAAQPDEGRTWSSTALFAEPTKFNISNERALLRTRDGVVIAAWMNGAERKAAQAGTGARRT